MGYVQMTSNADWAYFQIDDPGRTPQRYGLDTHCVIPLAE